MRWSHRHYRPRDKCCERRSGCRYWRARSSGASKINYYALFPNFLINFFPFYFGKSLKKICIRLRYFLSSVSDRHRFLLASINQLVFLHFFLCLRVNHRHGRPVDDCEPLSDGDVTAVDQDEAGVRSLEKKMEMDCLKKANKSSILSGTFIEWWIMHKVWV